MYDFDKLPSRKGTACVKWDASAPWKGVSTEDAIPMWVADMDFEAPDFIVDALRRRVDHAVFGYNIVPDSYYDAVIEWFRKRHGVTFKREQFIYTTGVVPAISAVIKALVPPGGGVLVLTPVYNCFFSSIRNNGCRLVDSPLRQVPLPALSSSSPAFSYEIDFDDLEAKAAQASMLLLCNPHNPAGRVWTRAELEKVAAIASRAGIPVVSDEIHNEIILPGYKYIPMASVEPQTITLCSPSKSFNTAGLQIANIVCPDAQKREAIDRAVNINEICDVNPFGPIALEAAYSGKGEVWVRELAEYIAGNYGMALRVLSPLVPVARLEGTYLLWLDCRAFGLCSEDMARTLLERHKVWVQPGTIYGAEGYLRVNLAAPRDLVREGLSRIAGGLRVFAGSN